MQLQFWYNMPWLCTQSTEHLNCQCVIGFYVLVCTTRSFLFPNSSISLQRKRLVKEGNTSILEKHNHTHSSQNRLAGKSLTHTLRKGVCRCFAPTLFPVGTVHWWQGNWRCGGSGGGGWRHWFQGTWLAHPPKRGHSAWLPNLPRTARASLPERLTGEWEREREAYIK